MKLVNLTRHVVNVYDSEGKEMKLAIPPSGEVARVESDLEKVEWPVYRFQNNVITGLPEPEEGTVFVVSDIVRKALPERKDLASPSQPVKIGLGYVGCKILIVNA